MSNSWFDNMPSLGPNSIAPAPYKPPVFWTMFWMVVAVMWGGAFMFGLAWVILSPLMPPTGMP